MPAVSQKFRRRPLEIASSAHFSNQRLASLPDSPAEESGGKSCQPWFSLGSLAGAARGFSSSCVIIRFPFFSSTMAKSDQSHKTGRKPVIAAMLSHALIAPVASPRNSRRVTVARSRHGRASPRGAANDFNALAMPHPPLAPPVNMAAVITSNLAQGAVARLEPRGSLRA